MCSVPVMFGGGIAIMYVSRESAGSALASKRPCSSQKAYHFASVLEGE